MFRNALFVSVIALGAAGVAQAQDLGPRLAGGGEDAQVVYSERSNNVVGGGDNTRIAYGPDVTTEGATGLVARLENVNGDQRLVHGPAAAPSGSMLAGHAAAQPRG